MRLGNCRSLTTRPMTDTWYRAILPTFQHTALQTSQSKHFPSRFNEGHGLFDILYLAEDPTVALFEVQALLGSPQGPSLPNPHQAWVIINVSVTLQRIVDLTLLNEQQLIDATIQELTGDWQGYQLRTYTSSRIHSIQPAGFPAPTQSLGDALFRVNPPIEGFLTASAKVPTHMNLVVFPEQLYQGSHLAYTDHNGVQHSITGTTAIP